MRMICNCCVTFFLALAGVRIVLAYSAVGFEISADLAGCTGRCWCKSFSAGHTARCSNFLVERALSEYVSFPAVFPREL